MNLAIIIPALNEAGSIGAVLKRIPAGLAQQIIVVDNGSADGTAGVAAHAGAQVIPEPRRGYGQACLTGLAHLRAEIDTIAFLDADGSDDPQILLELLDDAEHHRANKITVQADGIKAKIPFVPMQHVRVALAREIKHFSTCDA